MKKEKITRPFAKPELSLICPPKMLYHLSPEQVLTQHFQEAQQEVTTKHHSQNLRQLSSAKKTKPMTCMDWFKGSQHAHKQYFCRQTDDNLIELRTQSFVKRKEQKSKQQHRRFICKNSPYLKNRQQYERMMNNLKPIKGPTDSLIKQIKRHNDQNRKNAQNVLLATKDSFKQKIMKYSSRIGLKSSQKIFIMNSKDIHIRQALLRNGWVESTDLSSTFFHLKWFYTDSPLDYAKLQQGQFYNHFKNNQQLTNKNLFRKNIYKNPSHLRPNYPSTFDLQLNGNQQKFQFEYIKYQFLKILDYLHNYIFEHHKGYYDRIMRVNCLNVCYASMGGLINFTGDKNKQKQLVRVLETHLSQNKQTKQLRQILYSFCFTLCLFQDNEQSKNRKYSLISINTELNSSLKTIKEQMKKLQIQILAQDLEMTPGQKIKDTLQNVLELDKFLLFLIVYLQKVLKNKYRGSFGMQNWWIIKPAGVSRGTGIKIERDYGKIVSSKYGKVVQKYIQRPLILSCGRKFDIRQWVLVRSFLPLEVYMFKNCYCRFSAQKYNPQSFRSLSVHLTNYSKQKQSFIKTGKTLQSIKCQEQFHKEIDQLTYIGKWLQIKKQIKQQIIKSLKCCQYEVEDKAQCFQVFGFDILLDQNYTPWVLEVNMSPACEKRAEFLDEYLREMADGVVDLVEERDIRNWEKLIVEEDFAQKMLRNKYKGKISQQDAAAKIQRFYRKYRKIKNSKNLQLNFQGAKSTQQIEQNSSVSI